jgi:hypothetical protein
MQSISLSLALGLLRASKPTLQELRARFLGIHGQPARTRRREQRVNARRTRRSLQGDHGGARHFRQPGDILLAKPRATRAERSCCRARCLKF